MTPITIEKNRIAYYGNPAGYLQNTTAVVDSLFQKEDLTHYLAQKGYAVQWEDGVLDGLIAGTIVPGEKQLKSVRIWQLKPEVEVGMKFIGLQEMRQLYGDPNPNHYRVAYDGKLETNNLEAIYTKCNLDHPKGYHGHSMSMSDVVELYDQTGSSFHYCDTFGFADVKFQPPQLIQSITMEQTHT